MHPQFAGPVSGTRVNHALQKTFALLTYGKVLLFETAGDNIDFSKPKGCFRFSRKQTEAVEFLNNTDMLITNEQGGFYRTTFR